MAKLDRLGWAAGMAFSSYGARIGIRVSDPTVLERARDHLPPLSIPLASPVVDDLYSLIVGGPGERPGIRRYNLLYAGAARLSRTTDIDELFEDLESLLHFNVALRAQRRLFVHAGVVGWRGKAIVIPGRSHSGKSSLVAALVRAGATYYSDEYAVLDARGRVHPYSKRLSLRGADGERPRVRSAEEIGGQIGKEPLPVGLVLVTRYQAGARWRPRALSQGQAALALLDNTVLARARPEQTLTALRHALPAAAAVKSKRGEAQDIVEPLLTYLE